MADKPETNGAASTDVANETRRLEARVRELIAENEKLKEDLARTKIERDDFLSALRFHAPGQFFTAEDLAEFRKNAITGDELLRELDEIARQSQ
jgi:hypothetical protein